LPFLFDEASLHQKYALFSQAIAWWEMGREQTNSMRYRTIRDGHQDGDALAAAEEGPVHSWRNVREPLTIQGHRRPGSSEVVG
jgi:hypothetical protein